MEEAYPSCDYTAAAAAAVPSGSPTSEGLHSEEVQWWTPRGTPGASGPGVGTSGVAGRAAGRSQSSDKVGQKASEEKELEFSTWNSEDLDTIRSDLSGMIRERHREANVVVTKFVKSMVRGRNMNVVLPSGSTTTCFCSLSRGLDELRIRVREHDRHARQVPLAELREIVAGSDVSRSIACKDLETPLDGLSVTLAIRDECITFRMKDIEERDTLAMCLTLFRNQLRGERETSPADLFADISAERSYSNEFA